MKNYNRWLFLFLLLCLLPGPGLLRAQEFKYVLMSDTHIGAATAAEDLARSIADINALSGIDFVLITGDITEMGTKEEIDQAKALFSTLKVPYYILAGNHDTGWSESGGVDFIRTFGYDKFSFDHKGVRFIGCASGPYVRMSDGHIPRDAVLWLDSLVRVTPVSMPVVFANHYPMDQGLDNWYEAVDRLKKLNIQYLLCGHGHSNRAMDLEGIPGAMGRSNLRAKDSVGGYNIVSMTADSVHFTVKRPGIPAGAAWHSIALRAKRPQGSYPRPDFSINQKYPGVKPRWTYHAPANVVSTPATDGRTVVFGNSLGVFEGLSFKTGKRRWAFATGGAIYSSPVIAGSTVIAGSGDGNIYALHTQSGRLKWKVSAGKAVLGSAVVQGSTVYIGASDGAFRAIDIATGTVKWTFSEVEGAVAGTPLIYQGMVIFGSWGRHLYALDLESGRLNWKWNNGSQNRMFSPAMCTPVASGGIVFIAAPDKVLTAIDAASGRQLWRNAQASVRESLGLSEDGQLVFGKTMNNDIVAYKAAAADTGIHWRLNMQYGYEHVPSMLAAAGGQVVFGTKNGVVYAFDPKAVSPLWAHKIDNSMVNTVSLPGRGLVLAATMDGVVTLLEVGK